MSRQSKRARFAAKQALRRAVERCRRTNAHKPGFLGVAVNLHVNGLRFGLAAMFARTTPALPQETPASPNPLKSQEN